MTNRTRKRKTMRESQRQIHNQTLKRSPTTTLLKNDYYTYVNLKWLKKTKLPNKYNIIDEFSTLQRKIDKEIEKNIIPILLKDKNIHNLYDSIYNFNSEFTNSQFYLLMNVLK